jgi:hypothetical protein
MGKIKGALKNCLLDLFTSKWRYTCQASGAVPSRRLLCSLSRTSAVLPPLQTVGLSRHCVPTHHCAQC